MRRFVCVVVVAIGVMLPAGPAFGLAAPGASCNGIGGSGSAPGQLDHEKAKDFGAGPGASYRAFVSQEINAEAAAMGIAPGAIHRIVAQTHASSADACFGSE